MAMSYITARFHEGTNGRADCWIVDGAFHNTTRDRAEKWAGACLNNQGAGPKTIVLDIEDHDEAAALYRARVMSIREVELLTQGKAA